MNYLFSLIGTGTSSGKELAPDLTITVNSQSDDFFVTDLCSGFTYQVFYNTLIKEELLAPKDILKAIMNNIEPDDLFVYVSPGAKITIDRIAEINQIMF